MNSIDSILEEIVERTDFVPGRIEEEMAQDIARLAKALKFSRDSFANYGEPSVVLLLEQKLASILKP